jgi:hypothetical protein
MRVFRKAAYNVIRDEKICPVEIDLSWNWFSIYNFDGDMVITNTSFL